MTESSDYSKSIVCGSDEYFSRSLLGGSDEVMDIQCEPCQKEGSSTDALKYCINCKENLCEKCFKHHSKFKAFHDHTIQDLGAGNPILTSCSKSSSDTLANMLTKLDMEPVNVQQGNVDMKSSSIELRTLTAQKVSTIDLTTNKNKTGAFIRGLAMIQTNYCVVTDGNNKSVRVVDTRTKCVTSEISPSKADNVDCVTSVNDDNVAVAVSIKGVEHFVFFSVSTSGIISDIHKTFGVKYAYQGIVHTKDRFYATISNQVDVISDHGQIITTLTNDSFGSLRGIALSYDQTSIYLCSRTKNTVFSLDMGGKIKGCFKDTELSEPYNVTVDSQGHLFVYSNKTLSIHQLTADLKKAHVIIKDIGMSAFAFSNTDNSLYLARGNEISVYKMIYQ